MSLLARLPQLTLLVALPVFTLSLYLTITSGAGLAQPVNIVFIVLLALSIAGLFLAQDPNNERAAFLLWFSAGVWGAAAYLNFQMLGLAQLLVAVGAALSAFYVERESRAFSFAGPALFVGTEVLVSALGTILTR